jgi:protein-tyrosine phosphatase
VDCIHAGSRHPESLLFAVPISARYSNLLEVYQQTFGVSQVLWTPIEDFLFVDINVLLHQSLPFLAAADQNNQKVVVHCSGGSGRTGHVLAAWLVAGRGFSKQGAIATIQKTGRNPYEAVIAAPFKGRTPWQAAAELNQLLHAVDSETNVFDF